MGELHGEFNGNGYGYFKLQKWDQNFFRDVAVSRSPIMKESAYLFGDGKYQIVHVWIRIIEDEFFSRRNGNDTGSFHEKSLFEFHVHDSDYNDVPVDLDKLNMSIVSNMMEKVKETLQLDQGRSVQK